MKEIAKPWALPPVWAPAWMHCRLGAVGLRVDVPWIVILRVRSAVCSRLSVRARPDSGQPFFDTRKP
ncbi:MAG: hypothetical protein ACO1PM_17625 [Acidovorax sp.]